MRLYITSAIFGLLFMSCSNILDDSSSQNMNDIVINIDGKVSEVTTRATASCFEKGDIVGLYAINYSDSNKTPGELKAEGNQADNSEYVFDGSRWSAVEKAYYKDSNTNVDIIIYYPYKETIEDVGVFPFEVSKNQNEDTDSDMSAYEASDFLWGKTENVSPSENTVTVLLEHKMSSLIVKLVEGQGFQENEFSSLEKNVIVTNTTRKASINFSNGIVIPIGTAQSDGIVMCPQSDGSWRAVLVPQTLAAGCQLLSITVDGISYGFSVDEALEYNSGRQRVMTITVNKKSHSGTYEFQMSECEVSPWTEDLNSYEEEARQYLIVDVQSPGTLEETINNLGKNPAKIRNLKVTGKVGPSDFYFMRDKMEMLEGVNMLEAVCEDNSIPDNALCESSIKSFIFPPSVRIIGENAFNRSKLRHTLNLPDSLRRIGSSAFYDTRISSVVFPSKLEYIGSDCFSSCPFPDGQQLLLPDTVTDIGLFAFSNIRFGGFFILPESLKRLEAKAIIGDFSNGLTMPDAESFRISGCTFKGPLKLLPTTTLNNTAFSGCSFTGSLVIPDGISHIPGGCFDRCLFENVIFPESLKSIGMGAFHFAKIGRVLNLPEGLRKIEDAAFGSSPIEEIHLPSTLIEIGHSAFTYGYAKLIVSLADNPPVVDESQLSADVRNNCQVSVPEKSVGKYRADPFWGQFKRLYANFRFYLSHKSISCLIEGCDKDITLYAPSGMGWNVKSKPDWVDLSVLEGNGKTNIHLAIHPGTSSISTLLSDIHRWGREGEVVFQLCDKNAEVTLPIYQITKLSGDVKDGEVVDFQYATKGNGINIVFLGDGYDAVDVSGGGYLGDMRKAYEHFFAIQPYKQYADYFNVSAIVSIADESGVGTVQKPTLSKFSTVFGDRIQTDYDKCLSYVKSKLPDLPLSRTLVVLVVNSNKYDGITYMYDEGAALAVCPVSDESYPYDFRGVIQHEAGGHGFGKLADEYIYHNNDIRKCSCSCCKHLSEFEEGYGYGWYRNLSLENDPFKVPWNHLYFHPNYSDVVNVFEGGFCHSYGIYRSEKLSCMNNNVEYYSAISRQAIVERIMQYSGCPFSIESFYANDISNDNTRSYMSYQIDWPGRHYDEGPIILKGYPKTEE